MDWKSRPYGLLPSRWFSRWLVYAVCAALIFTGGAALILGLSGWALVAYGATAGVFMATASILVERPWVRSRHERGRT